jgi:FLYWCH zinc finger domain
VPANSRGGIVLLHEDYRYVRNWKSQHKQIWRCTETGCGAYLHTNLFDVADDNAAINGKLRNLQATYFLFTR